MDHAFHGVHILVEETERYNIECAVPAMGGCREDESLNTVVREYILAEATTKLSP